MAIYQDFRTLFDNRIALDIIYSCRSDGVAESNIPALYSIITITIDMNCAIYTRRRLNNVVDEVDGATSQLMVTRQYANRTGWNMVGEFVDYRSRRGISRRQCRFSCEHHSSIKTTIKKDGSQK
jgi:hypothetical protein